MAEYDVEPPPDRLDYRVQLRKAFSTDSGDVTRFVVQLEYWLDGNYREVVRYDHNPDFDAGHDVTEAGLHRDVYRNGRKYRVEQVTGPLPSNEAFTYAEDDLYENVERYITRFKKWHGVNDTTTR